MPNFGKVFLEIYLICVVAKKKVNIEKREYALYIK